MSRRGASNECHNICFYGEYYPRIMSNIIKQALWLHFQAKDRETKLLLKLPYVFGETGLSFVGKLFLKITSSIKQVIVLKWMFNAQCIKKALMQFTDNEGRDQPAHSRRLIWAVVVRLQNQWILSNMLTNRECSYPTVRVPMLIWAFAVRWWHKGLFRSLPIIFYLNTETPYHTSLFSMVILSLPLIKKGSRQFLAKECAQYRLTA